MFKMEIETGGAAFRDPFTGEEDEVMEKAQVRGILARVVYELEQGASHGTIMDINGNKVGEWSL